MQTKQIEVFLLHSLLRGGEIISRDDMSKSYFADEYTLIGSGIATINMLDSVDVNQSQISLLRKKKQAIQAKCQVEVESIDDRFIEFALNLALAFGLGVIFTLAAVS